VLTPTLANNENFHPHEFSPNFDADSTPKGRHCVEGRMT
jgi:hypothetical protein